LSIKYEQVIIIREFPTGTRGAEMGTDPRRFQGRFVFDACLKKASGHSEFNGYFCEACCVSLHPECFNKFHVASCNVKAGAKCL